MTNNEFLKEVKKVNQSRHHKASGSFKMRDFFRYYNQHKTNHNFILEKDYGKIINTINFKLRELLLQSKDIDLPYKLGSICLYKTPSFKIFKDGKLINNLPIDWNRTLNLWYEDEDCYKNRVILKIDTPYIFSIRYRKKYAYYSNKCLIRFEANRELKQLVKDKLLKGQLDAFVRHGKTIYQY